MPENLVRSRLLDQRRALLDLGTRNRLINVPMRVRGVRTIEIVDEKSSEIYRLLTQGKGLTFLPGRTLAVEERGELDADDRETAGIPQPVEAEQGNNGLAARHVDTRLQTRLTSEGLQKRLFDIWYDARTLEEEQGVNILYLAVGLLRWFDDDKSETARHAPLVLLPVQLDRTSAAGRFTLRMRGEPASPNLSIQAKLKAEFGLTIEDFPDEDEIDIPAYLSQVSATVAGKLGWRVMPDAMVLGFFSFAKFLMYRDLDPENWPDGSALHDHDPIAALLGDGFVSQEPIVGDHESVDPVIPPLALNHVLDADSSQAVAIEEAMRGRHLVIKGPPGTGKSQTIANIIAGAALQGKKILFVAEKMAALDVVHRRLRQVGLGPMTLELHSTKVNKRLVLEELRRTRDLDPRAGVQDPSIIARMNEVQDDLNQHAAMLHTAIEPGGISPYRLFGHLLRGREAGGLPGFALAGASTWTAQEAQARSDLVAELADRLAIIGNPAKHIWRGVQREALDPSGLERLASLLRSVEADLEAVEEAVGTIGRDFDVRVTNIRDLDTLLRVVRAAIALPVHADRQSLAQAVWRDDKGALADLVALGRGYQKVTSAMTLIFQSEAWAIDLRPIRSELADRGGSLLRYFSGSYRRAKARFKELLAIAVPDDPAKRLSLLDAMIGAQDMRRRFEAQRRLGALAFGARWDGEKSDWDKLQAITDWCREHVSPLGPGFLTKLATRPRGGELGSLGASIVQSVPRLFDDLKELSQFLNYDLAATHDVADCGDLPVARLEAQLRLWLAGLEGVTRWIAFNDRCDKARELGLGMLMDGLLNGTVEGSVLAATFERAYYEALRAEFFKRLPDLKRFDGEMQNRTVENFRTLDRDRIALAREAVLLKHLGDRPLNGGGIGPLGVLNGEFAKKRNHLPIRQLLDKAGPAVQRLKPVMMMSPLSISQFLKPGALTFDLLVIDEASQIEPVDALGAIARARQIVVVGDERQLPPTRFFAKLTGDIDEREEDEETFKASDAESVLDLCLAKGMSSRLLNWHYRSKHQSLITVSNREFYENRLLIVPSPYQLGETIGGKTGGGNLGLAFRHLPHAHYDRGNTRTNPQEAKEVAQAIIVHARHRASQSLGVATFSVAQRQAILKELELLRRANPATEAFFNREGNEPFFVKNLENIQGDERDVIFISVGYGRSAEGYLAMKFGPLNLDGGERRLNVLISRAKLRCEVFSSIKGEDIDLARASARGVVALKLFLTFAETGRLGSTAETGKGPDSLFEEQVAAQLRARGHIISEQVGSVGFFVDLAVVDPAKPRRYLIGIECDGAQYHASRSARDRDRLRQHVLEAQGWIIHRIWSTDWFLRPQEELAKVEAAIERAKTAWRGRDGMPGAAPGPLGGVAEPKSAELQSWAEPEVQSASVASTTPEMEQASAPTAPSSPPLPPVFASYVEAVLQVAANEELQEISATRMAEYVLDVVKVEGPVHEQEIVTRIRDAFRLARAGARIREAVLDGIDVARMTSKISGGPFYTLPGELIMVRDRSGVNSFGLRRPDMLPTQEIEAAFFAMVAANFGAPRDTLIISVARAFGFAATSSVLKERLDDVLTVMLFRGELKRQNDLIVVG